MQKHTSEQVLEMDSRGRCTPSPQTEDICTDNSGVVLELNVYVLGAMGWLCRVFQTIMKSLDLDDDIQHNTPAQRTCSPLLLSTLSTISKSLPWRILIKRFKTPNRPSPSITTYALSM